MKQTVIVAGQLFAFEAIDGRATLNGAEATPQELQRLGEVVHHVRITSDLQAAAKRRAERGRHDVG